jgi:hypothetical protein
MLIFISIILFLYLRDSSQNRGAGIDRLIQRHRENGYEIHGNRKRWRVVVTDNEKYNKFHADNAAKLNGYK